MTEVAVIGIGPWGLAAFERLITGAIERPEACLQLTIHVIEPGTPGAGVYAGDQPDYLILNTPCGQHSMHPYPERAEGRLGTGFYEWAVAAGYTWVGDGCEVTTAGRPISPHDFLPRRLMGEYLSWFYRCLVKEAPPGVRIVRHATSVVSIVEAGDKERIALADGIVLDVDHAILTSGHTPNRPVSHGSEVSPYPVGQFEGTIPPGSSVAVRGMGLVAIDVVTALTTGRGGRFVRHGDRLRYRASGHEPRITLFSRSGYPYCAKSIGSADITDGYCPVICTPEAALALRAEAVTSGHRVDARAGLLPMMLAEMTVAFYAQSARLERGATEAATVTEHLAEAWRSGHFKAAVAECREQHGPFDPFEHLFVGQDEMFVSSKDYQARVTEALQSDVTEALVPDGASPVKHAHEVLRALRDTVRTVVEFGGLTLESHRDFQANVRTRIARIVAGPPVYRSEALLALIDAEVVRMPFGPSPAVTPDGDGMLVSSQALDRPYAERVDQVIAGHLDEPTAHRSASPMLHSMFSQGRLRQFELNGEPLGSVQLTEDFHPVGRDGKIASRLWVFGGLTEGARYYTAYIPSPSSRARAFVDAGICADRILGGRG